MARIPDEALERLKREVSLARLMEAQGVMLISQGKDLACRCPWHEGDDTPSCIVSPKTNLWHCFGCDAGGSVIDWVMRRHKVSFRHACELLAKQHPALAAAASTDTPAAAVKLSAGKLRTAQSFSLAAGDQELLDQVIDFYHTTLKSSPEALEYLERRGLGSPELIERFRLGYANRTLAYRLAPKQYKAGAEMRTALQRVGILRDSGHEHFNGSIVVPLFGASADGAPRAVVGAYARKLLDNLRAGTPKHLYLPGPHRGVFNREGLEGQSDIILCEALIDATTFWAAGYRNVTSCFGVNGMTEELLGAPKSCGTQRILIAFDRDEAGDRGAEALSQRLMADGLDCYRIQFPKGMDANEYAQSDAGMDLLKDPHLLDRILADFTRCGVDGEESNKLIGYLAATSRKLDARLAVMVQSSSAAGKSSLMEAVLAFMPDEDKVQYSAMTGQSLFYMGAMDLKHKILALAEEAGAARASYALKLLQSEGTLSIASTGKDPETGKLITQEYRGGRPGDTVRGRRIAIRRFIAWCEERTLREPKDITKAILERYQRHLFYYRKADGKPMALSSQFGCLAPFLVIAIKIRSGRSVL
jgi:DNA primase catalytic core